MTVPLNVMVPSVGVSMPESAYISVDFPAPDAPILTVKSPLYNSRPIFFRTCCMVPPLEKLLLRPSVLMSISFMPKTLLWGVSKAGRFCV